MYVSAPWACSAHRGQKRVSVPLKLELHRWFKLPCGRWKANTSPLYHWNISPTPSTMFFNVSTLGLGQWFPTVNMTAKTRLQKKQERQASNKVVMNLLKWTGADLKKKERKIKIFESRQERQQSCTYLEQSWYRHQYLLTDSVNTSKCRAGCGGTNL